MSHHSLSPSSTINAFQIKAGLAMLSVAEPLGIRTTPEADCNTCLAEQVNRAIRLKNINLARDIYK